MGDNIENEYYRFKYICSLSDEDKIGNLDSLLSEKLKALVIASLASDTLKERFLDTLSGIYVKSFVISSFKSDAAKLKYLNKLKKGALKTASDWCSWEESSAKFFETVTKLNKMKSVTQEVLETKSKFFFDIYVKYETKDASFKKFVGRRLRTNHPRIYKMYRKLIRK